MNLRLRESADICVRSGVIYIKTLVPLPPTNEADIDNKVEWLKVDNPNDFMITKFIDVKKDADYVNNKYMGLMEL
jgi:hypothetical protein